MNLYTTLVKYLQSIKMPTPEENIAMINAIREENKNKTLSVMNKKTQDDRDLMNQLKKIGIPGYMGMFEDTEPPMKPPQEKAEEKNLNKTSRISKVIFKDGGWSSTDSPS